MIAGCMDIGTNTTLALLAEQRRGTLHVLRDTLTHNRLGESLDGNNMISAQAIALNVDLIAEISRDFRSRGSRDVIACGTAALRRARNRDEFISAVRDVTGVEVRVLSGHDEAAMTYSGAISGLDVLPNEHISAIDIGGGSSEIIEGMGGKPGKSCSLDIGAVLLTKKFFTANPPHDAEIEALREDVKAHVAALRDTFAKQNTKWVLIGGTPVSLAILKMNIPKYDPAKIGGVELSITDLEYYITFFRNKSSDEIQALPGMPTGRGRYIFAGTLLLQELFIALNITDTIVSERGLRHGFWLTMFA